MLDSLFNKFAGPQASKFITKRLQHRCFLVNIAKFLKIRILYNIGERLLLYIVALKWIELVIVFKVNPLIPGVH